MPSPAFISAALAAETDEIFALLVTLEAPGLAEPIRVCSGGAALTSQDRLFVAFPFSLQLPGETSDSVASRARLRIDNLSGDVAAKLRGLTRAPTATLELVLASAPDVIERRWRRLTLADPAFTLPSIEVDLAPRDFSEETFPKQSFTRGRTPALFD